MRPDSLSLHISLKREAQIFAPLQLYNAQNWKVAEEDQDPGSVGYFYVEAA